MIAAWMVYSALVAALLGLAAHGLERVCERLGRPRRWVWLACLVGTLGLTASALVRLSDRPADAAVAELHSVGVAQVLPAESLRSWPVEVLRAARGATSRAADWIYEGVGRVGADRRLASAWAVLSVALLVLLAWTLGRARTLRRQWRPGRIDGVDLLVSSESGPAVVGLLHPVIVVPAWLLGEPASRQRLVVAHEDEHRRARDHVMLAAACVATCVQPWNPALWWMLRRVRLAIELDCDARVLSRGASAGEYGMLLLEIAGRGPGRLAGAPAPALADSTTHLERRILAMTEQNGRKGGLRAALAATSALLLATLACTTDLPTAEAVDELDVAEAESRAKAAGLVSLRADEGEPVYLIDGIIVEATAARKLAPEEIQSIEVVKGTAARRTLGEKAAAGAVYVATKARRPLGTPADSAELRALEVKGRLVRSSGQRVALMKTNGREATAEADAPLLVIDGVMTARGTSLERLDPASIERVEIVKGEAAARLYDHPRAVNGVILITTKKRDR